MFRRFSTLLAIVAATFSDLVASGETSALDTLVLWTVRVTDPASGLVAVRARVPGAALQGRDSLAATFRDLGNDDARLRRISATRGGDALNVEKRSGRRGYRCAIRLRESPLDVMVEYVIDPTFAPAGRAVAIPEDARGRLTDQLGVLRTQTIFPELDLDYAQARITFELPQGWVAVTPWPRSGADIAVARGAFEAVDYLGVGPFAVREVENGNMLFRTAVIGAEGNTLLEKLPELIETIQKRIGMPQEGGIGTYSVIVVPEGFMRGGSAGRRSVVQPPHAVTLAHEIFHWWSPAGRFAPEAAWFGEGFTEFYGIRLAHVSGLVSPEFASECFADLNAEMRLLEREGPLSLTEASMRYRQDNRSARIVYSKGALLALFMERTLERTEESLDVLMRNVLADNSPRWNNQRLKELLESTYSRVVGETFDRYVTDPTPLPDLGLGPGTGRTGAAKYLPESITGKSP